MTKYTALIILIFLTILTENQILGNLCRSAINGKRHRDPKTCENYRICLNHETNFNECPHGFFYNHPKQICSDPKLIEENDLCNLENLCRKKKNGDRLAHPNCKFYYLCMNHKPVLEHCPEEMHLNIKKNICSLPQFIDGECGASSNLCDGQPDGSNIAHSECDKFYYCYQNEQYIRSCKAGLHFNPSLKFCQEPAEAKCIGKRCIGQPDATLYPHNLCEHFYFCFNNNDYVKACKDGLHFNPILKYCQEPEKAECVTNVCHKKPNGSLEPHENVKKYYFCYNGNPLVKLCEEGLYFNPTLKYCEIQNFN